MAALPEREETQQAITGDSQMIDSTVGHASTPTKEVSGDAGDSKSHPAPTMSGGGGGGKKKKKGKK